MHLVQDFESEHTTADRPTMRPASTLRGGLLVSPVRFKPSLGRLGRLVSSCLRLEAVTIFLERNRDCRIEPSGERVNDLSLSGLVREDEGLHRAEEEVLG